MTATANAWPLPTPAEQVEFLRKLQRLLDEGQFVSTYKYALLLSLAELAVERGDASGAPLALPTRAIAEKFVRLYWRQASPYVAPGGEAEFVLYQSTDRQAAVLQAIEDARRRVGGLLTAAERHPEIWKTLVGKVEQTVRIMPLWKLQTIGGEEVRFLYRPTDDPRVIELLPGVASHLRHFQGLVRTLVQGCWVTHLRGISVNFKVLGQHEDLAEFLFGTSRASLAQYQRILRDFQGNECLYCRRPVKGAGEVDHFIPWSRYPLDLGHNLVLAHKECNSRKRNLLAAPVHLETWTKRNNLHVAALTAAFDECRLPHDLGSTLTITRWAYEEAESLGAHGWVRGDEVVPIGGEWRRAIDMPGTRWRRVDAHGECL